MRTVEHEPVRLDCGCTVRPTAIEAGTIITCSGHGLRHGLTTHCRVTYSYEARRLDPPDPHPDDEEVVCDGAADA